MLNERVATDDEIGIEMGRIMSACPKKNVFRGNKVEKVMWKAKLPVLLLDFDKMKVVKEQNGDNSFRLEGSKVRSKDTYGCLYYEYMQGFDTLLTTFNRPKKVTVPGGYFTPEHAVESLEYIQAPKVKDNQWVYILMVNNAYEPILVKVFFNHIGGRLSPYENSKF